MEVLNRHSRMLVGYTLRSFLSSSSGTASEEALARPGMPYSASISCTIMEMSQTQMVVIAFLHSDFQIQNLNKYQNHGTAALGLPFPFLQPHVSFEEGNTNSPPM